jgi:hypothetical protein
VVLLYNMSFLPDVSNCVELTVICCIVSVWTHFLNPDFLSLFTIYSSIQERLLEDFIQSKNSDEVSKPYWLNILPGSVFFPSVCEANRNIAQF